MERIPNVLIVDDDHLTCWGLKKILTGQNMTVTIVGTGEDALSELRTTFYCCVFLDIHLPDMNGLDMMGEIRKFSPRTKVVIMTGDNSEEYRRRALSQGALQYIEKPFGVLEVKNILSIMTDQDAEEPSSEVGHPESPLA